MGDARGRRTKAIWRRRRGFRRRAARAAGAVSARRRRPVAVCDEAAKTPIRRVDDQSSGGVVDAHAAHLRAGLAGAPGRRLDERVAPRMRTRPSSRGLACRPSWRRELALAMNGRLDMQGAQHDAGQVAFGDDADDGRDNYLVAVVYSVASRARARDGRRLNRAVVYGQPGRRRVRKGNRWRCERSPV